MTDHNEIVTELEIVAPEAVKDTFDPAEFEIDFEKYLELSREFDASEDQQRQLIEALWQIMLAIFDFKYGIHPVQTAVDARCPSAAGENGGGPDASAILRSLIAQSDNLAETFAQCAEPEDDWEG